MKPVQSAHVCACAPVLSMCMGVWQPSRQSGITLPLYQTTAVDASNTSAPHMKGGRMEMAVVRRGGWGSRDGGRGSWSGWSREGWKGRMNGRAARGGCQAPNFPAQMEPNTAQHGPSSPQIVCVRKMHVWGILR